MWIPTLAVTSGRKRDIALVMTAEEELAPALAELRGSHDVLPFIDRMIPAGEAVFRPLPDEMLDVIAASPDFRLPERGTAPVWIQIAGEGGGALEIIVARPQADGELWVIAPLREDT